MRWECASTPSVVRSLVWRSPYPVAGPPSWTPVRSRGTLLVMESASFERSLLAFSRRKPFQSFTVELSSGERITVDHPEALVHRGGLAVYVALDGTPTLFDHAQVTRMIGSPDNQAAAA